VSGRRSWGGIRKLRSGRWQALWLDPDTRNKVPAPETFATKAAAGRWLDAKRTDMERGVAIDERAANQPLRDWWPGYQLSYENLKPGTRASYEVAWRLRVEPAFGSVRVRNIRPSQIDAWVAKMKASGVSPAKIVGAHGVLRRLLDRAVRDRVISVNPCALRETRLPRLPLREHPILTPAEVARLSQAMRREDDKVLTRLLAYGGLRIGEALALRKRNLDPVRHTLTIRESATEVSGQLVVGTTKTSAVRTITLPKSLSAELAALTKLHDAPEALIFSTKTGTHRRYRIWRRDSFDPARKKAGLDVNPHDLRATCASLLIDAGASVKDVQNHLGHASLATTMEIYTRVRPGRSADLAAKMDALMAEI